MIALEKVLDWVTKQESQALVSLVFSDAAKAVVNAVGEQMRQGSAQDRQRRRQQQRPNRAAVGEDDPEPVIDEGREETAIAQMLRFVSSPSGERVMLTIIRACTATGTETYMAAIAGANMYARLPIFLYCCRFPTTFLLNCKEAAWLAAVNWAWVECMHGQDSLVKPEPYVRVSPRRDTEQRAVMDSYQTGHVL